MIALLLAVAAAMLAAFTLITLEYKLNEGENEL